MIMTHQSVSNAVSLISTYSAVSSSATVDEALKSTP
eukprot:COSAG06_NODE_9099_length_1986_cov_3.188489_1_plen_36_part_00